MRDDVPAAVPLIALILGLVLGGALLNVWFAVAGLLACALLARRSLFLFAAIGIALAAPREVRPAFDPTQFVAIDAPLDREWTTREPMHVLRVARFEANGIAFDRPLALYARFAPPPIAMRTTLHAEGFLHESENGEMAMTVKSTRLLRYSGTLRRFDPERWNRAAAVRLEPLATQYPDEVALAEALALGRGERLTQQLRDGFRRGGTYHLLVFSGMQIAFAAAVIALLLRWLHAPRACDVLLLAFAILAPPFIGPTPSVSRASIGIGLYAISRLLKRPTSLANLWCVAAMLRLIIAPHDLTDAAFQLTYAGAGAMIFVARPFATKWLRWIAYAAAAELAITPLTLFHFHQYALGGSLSTIAMTPLIGLMLLISVAVCAAPSANLLLLIGALHRCCMFLNDIAANASGIFAAPPLAPLVVGFGAALIAIANTRGKHRALLVAGALAIPSIAAVMTSHSRHEVSARMIALDIGQGDAILLRDGTTAILIDGGPSDAVLLPQLADRGITHLDAVFLTHAHPDHCGGLPAVIDRLPVGEVWLSPRRFTGPCAERLLAAIAARHIPLHLVRDGDAATFGAIRLTAQAPPITFRRASENNASVVLRVQIGAHRLLLTGDVEREAEAWLADRDLRADVLKVAHHGSRSSSTAAFLDRVQPGVAVISCGRRNVFGHPHAEVLRALADRQIRVLRTDRDGTVEIVIPSVRERSARAMARGMPP